MVSKIFKKIPTRPTKERRSLLHRRKKYSIKTTVVATIITTFHRRLIKIFSKLSKICTRPQKNNNNKTHPKKQGNRILQTITAANLHRRPQYSGGGNRILPPPSSPEKRTIFLDLDETLIHSKSDSHPENYDFVVKPIMDGFSVDFYVLKRPFVDELLEFLSKRFELVVFTAGRREYASLVLDQLDRNSAISYRLYRDSCWEVNGKFVKDLAGLRRDLKRVVIVDDNPNSYALQPENAIPIRPFTDDLLDDELRRLMEFFEGSDRFEDMRDAVKQYVKDEKF
ncbi:carboxy-terminal domain RNA polymerase II polypeptide A small phosphatase 1-like [Camellia sinensis]|uniref:FCP1 homology domain-containing protein n=1 Tax=Camellia sinensis var. sinensis TaxID=542762 RepID=A0A4S4EN31_CAMSN|nr:carboxy-terminal domain RNA polymerase II polypeptide A small phosphatase 1-like [Camellia sinensis]THG17654.1 hypothetical protein TEA_014763 [Camellia sinensis var. sinensis]